MSNKYINELGVFDNKLGIKNAALLNAIEYSNTQSKQAEILTGQSGINLEKFGLETLKAIHKYQFDGIYEWAGKLRTIPLAKELAKNGFFGGFRKSRNHRRKVGCAGRKDSSIRAFKRPLF